MRPPGMNRQTMMSCGAVAGERPLRPRPRLHALRRGEEPALHGGAEPAAEQVAEVVAREGARGRAGDEQRDPRVGAPRGRHAEGDDRALAGQRREDRVERREEEGDQVGERRVDLEAAKRAHRRPAPVLAGQRPGRGGGAAGAVPGLGRGGEQHLGDGAPHCSHRPKTPAATRPSASSVSASRWRAATARRSSRRACRSSMPPAAAAWYAMDSSVTSCSRVRQRASRRARHRGADLPVVFSSHCAPTPRFQSSCRRRADGDRGADRRARSRRVHSTTRQTAKMIHGAITIRSLPVISPCLMLRC